MTKRFNPPFHIEVDFYDAKGRLLEWCEEWGDNSDATEVRYIVVDSMEQTISTHNTREKAQAAIKRLAEPQTNQGS